MLENGEVKEVIKDSKTECVFFPPPKYFKQLAIKNGWSSEDILTLESTEIESEQKRAKQKTNEDEL